ncbi:MAG TPA: hypothetical protein VN622_16420 [Clostridia bacterium]|nr:hypothetical protein [Clostridia bacterium]
MFRKILVAISFMLFATLALAAGPGKVEQTAAFSDASAPANITAALAPQGYRLTLYDGTVVDVWLRNSIPVVKQANSAAVYPELAPSTFVGVISFRTQRSDFRGLPVKAGTYTMRYEALPEDGNHMGVAAQPDFVLLVPIGADPGPDAKPSTAELLKLSAKATGISHPASFSMVPIEGASGFPSLFYTSEGFAAFAAEATTQSGKLPLALVVKGVAQQ